MDDTAIPPTAGTEALPHARSGAEVPALPGRDYLRSFTVMLLSGIYAFLLWVTCDQDDGVRATILGFVASVALAVAGLVNVSLVEGARLSEVSRLSFLFRPKLLATAAGVVFIATACTWLLLTGGITRSPFAAIFTITPVYFVAQLSNDRDRRRFEELAGAWVAAAPNPVERPRTLNPLPTLWRLIRSLQWAGLVLTLVTLTFGEVGLRALAGSLSSLFEAVGSCHSTAIAYVSFGITATLAAPSAFPAETRTRFLARVAGPKWRSYFV